MPTKTRTLRPLMIGVAALAMLACGGGDGGSSPPPPDNSPASIALSTTGSVNLVSGTTTTLTANVLTRDGRPIAGASVTWASSNPQVATVQGGLVTAILAGTTSITASVGSVTSPALTVVTTPGAPSQLGVKTQPAGAAVGAAFATPPVVEVRDAAGNAVPTAALAITANIATGGGSLQGTTTVTAVGGVATFTDLAMTGTVGQRTLSFSAPGVTPTTSAAFALAPGAPAALVIARQAVGGAVGAQLLTQPVVELRDISGNVSTGSTATITAGLTGFTGAIGGTVAVPAVAGVATFTNLVINGQPGNYALAFASTGLPGVSGTSMALPAIIFGLANEKVKLLDAGASSTVGLSTGSTASYATRAASRVTIDNTGRFTARAEGQAWVVATNALGSDSVLTIVTRGPTGPVLRTNLPTYALRPGEVSTIDLVLDPRGASVGVLTAIVSLNTQSFSPQYQIAGVALPGVQVSANETNPHVYRFSLVTTTPITSPVTFGRIQLMGGPAGSRLTLTMTALEAASVEGTDLLGSTTSTFYPLAFR